jgi:hypothetical protein
LRFASAELEVGLGLREFGAHGVDLGRALRLPEILELRLRAREAVGGLAPLRRLVLLLQREERLAGLDLVAALHRELRKLAGERRGDTDILALGVALEVFLRRVVAARGGRREQKSHCVPHRRASGAPHRPA